MFDQYLPTIFLGLMALSIFIYAILDGYDLGVGILMPMDNEPQRDKMIATIGPFWDANETWLVLAVGILLIAFPNAHSLVLGHLYLPATFLLIGLIMRGVAFDFRAKAPTQYKNRWDRVFKIGSLVVTLMQGYMLGMYVMGFENTIQSVVFSLLSAIGVSAAYMLIGSAWLVYKTEGELQQQAAKWGKFAGYVFIIGMIIISSTNLYFKEDVAQRWLSFTGLMLMLGLLMASFYMYMTIDYHFKQILENKKIKNDYSAFLMTIVLYLIVAVGFAFSYFPYVVPGQMLASESISSIESLRIIFYGVAVVLPLIIAYTLFSYWIFRGKATDLNYD
ncbi:cytochrome d ubiquinol oxidase subunit II [Marinicellulosiphila megalodicopiae]|uniref:cytochrome d ubiquinol oxidase subunit II n=1 Tax=Marinicellulosiphila megalodicopiae TaxID=2724896 RepID=UPI003BB12203